MVAIRKATPMADRKVKAPLVDDVPPWSVLSPTFDLRTLKPSKPKRTPKPAKKVKKRGGRG